MNVTAITSDHGLGQHEYKIPTEIKSSRYLHRLKNKRIITSRSIRESRAAANHLQCTKDGTPNKDQPTQKN